MVVVLVLERVMHFQSVFQGSEAGCKALQHQDREGDEVQAGQGSRGDVRSPGLSGGSGQPGDAPFDQPSPGQQHKSSLGFRELDHFAVNSMFLRIVLRLFSCVALIDVRQLHLFVRLLAERPARALRPAVAPVGCRR